uniref:Uncharacterized protein n=1 Tax=Panagrolaimus davidi TaxID=227884 RepID=A0A914P0W8_9BILA
MANATTSKSLKDSTDHEYISDSKMGQMVFEQQVLLPLFTRIKYKGCRNSDFLDIKQLLLYIFDSFKYQKRNYLVDIFLKNNVYDLLFERSKPVEKPREVQKRPNVIVFKEVPWFLQKRQKTEALQKTLDDEAHIQNETIVESSSPVLISPLDKRDKVIKIEEDEEAMITSTFDEQSTFPELCKLPFAEAVAEGEEEESATEDLVKLIVDTYSREPPSIVDIDVKEEEPPLEFSSYDEQSTGYLDTLSDINAEPFVTVDYDISPSSSSKKQRFTKNLEGHNLYYVVSKYYYHHWNTFKDWSNRTAEITRKRAEAWNDIFRKMERDGIKDFNRESLPLNFRKFVSKLRTKKRNQLSGTGPQIEFTQVEEDILEYENSYIRLKRKCYTLKD